MYLGRGQNDYLYAGYVYDNDKIVCANAIPDCERVVPGCSISHSYANDIRKIPYLYHLPLT